MKDHLHHWPKEAGAKPSKATLDAVIKNCLAQEGTKTSIAVAMAMRPAGATQPQIIKVLGSPHRNALKRLTASGKVKRIGMPKQDGVSVYKIALKG